MKNVILASNSALYGQSYLEYLTDELRLLFKGVKELIFVPYARPSGISYDEYTQRAQNFFSLLGIKVIGLHAVDNTIKAVRDAAAFYIGGGNTFVLLKALYELDILGVLKEEAEKGKPYLGISAGSNISGVNIMTTNDMPIVYPPSFLSMGLVPFNINPHFLDPNQVVNHNGETRETRILEFHTQNSTPVVGLREGSWLRIKGKHTLLQGSHSARIFEKGKMPFELPSGSEIIF